MREATPEELKSVNDYIKSISYNPIVKELENIKAEINQIDMHQFKRTEVLKILDNHIKELNK